MKNKENLKMYINGINVEVEWENNNTIKEIINDDKNIRVATVRYGNNEQVGYLGKRYISDDKNMKVKKGDIVLYDEDKIVIFYDNHEWRYTKLGKIKNVDERIIKELRKEKSIIDIKVR